MKVGDLIRIKDPFDNDVGAYHVHLFEEIMLVTDIIDDIVIGDNICERVAINGVAVCISESGENRFPIEDLEVVS